MSVVQALLDKIAAKRGEPVNVSLARAMYGVHQAARGHTAPEFDDIPPGFKTWMIEQADAAIEEFRSAEIDTEEY